MMATRVIINADDFGLSASVNEAVQLGHERGILSSATVMANMPGFDEAVRIAARCPRLGVGVHLNLLRGAPLSEPRRITTLLTPQGKFFDSAGRFWKEFLLRRIDPAEIEAELSAQVRKVVEAGIIPTHVDSEKHLHALIPGLFEIVCRVAIAFHIRCVRVVREPAEMLPGAGKLPHRQRFKRFLLNRQGNRCASLANRHGLAHVDRFFGVAMTGRMTGETYRALFAHLPAGSLEIMCHPAVDERATGGGASRGWLDRNRPAEYRGLLDPAAKEALGTSGAALITYGSL